jgi:hypothetical protein
VHRQKDDFGVEAFSPKLLERLQAVETRHRDVKHNHVGPEAPRQVQGLAAVASHPHDVKDVTKKAAERFQERDVIVRQEDARSW